MFIPTAHCLEGIGAKCCRGPALQQCHDSLVINPQTQGRVKHVDLTACC